MAIEQKGCAIVRLATSADVFALERLIAASVHRLQAEDYSESQREAALGPIFGVDPVLLADGTYFVAVTDGEICACGGWSRRATPFGGGHSPARDDAVLDPEQDAAKIRALFVHPAYARRGLGSLILETCETAARAAGFRRAELTATLTGTKLFRQRGFVPTEEISIPLRNGESLPVLRMTKSLE
jgi:GNAT superfamily N-acetyltransferase